MIVQNIYFKEKFFSIIYALLFLVEIKSIKANISIKKIYSYREESFYLDKENPKKYYLYQNTKYEKEKNYDIILQLKNILKDSYDINIYIYTTNTYIYNLENLTKLNETTNDLDNYQYKIELTPENENYSEYSLSNFENNKNINISYYQFYYLVFLKGNKIDFFKTHFTLFNTLDEIEIFPNNLSNSYYYRYENNYFINNFIFIFKINRKYFHYKYLNIQLLSFYENSLFNIDIYQKNKTSEIFSHKNFNKLDYSMPINNTRLFYLNLSFIKNNKDNTEKNNFAIFFEFLNSDNNIFQNIPEKTKKFTFLSGNEIYFLSIIKNSSNNTGESNRNLFYVLNFLSKDDILINNNYFYLEYFLSDKNEYYDEHGIDINNNFLIDLINNNRNNFIKSDSIYIKLDSLFFFNIRINKNENLNKLLILKLYINDNNSKNKLKIKSIYFRFLPLILLTGDTYNYNKSYYKYYNSQNYLDNIGYYYIPMKNITKNKILFCPYENTMNLYFGEFDISKNLMLPSLENQKLYIINPYNSTLFNGITIITINKYNNYFIQFGEIDENILNNLKINIYKNDEKINKEIKINDNIKELYFFNIYSFNYSFILDINVIYGNVSVEYLSLDEVISDFDKNFYNIFPFNKEVLNKYIKSIDTPTLIDTSNIEIIRIINNQFINDIDISVNFYKSLLYINKYRIYNEIEENELLPLFISSYETLAKFKINLNQFTGEIKYKFFLINRNPFNEEYQDYNISISINNESFYLSQIDNNIFHIGVASILRFNQVKITNNCHKNLLVWVQIENFDESNYEVFYASQNYFNGVISTGKIYLFLFDYINIIKKKDIGLYPYKFIFHLEKPISSKCNGYYHQLLVNQNFDPKKLVFSPTNINSIYYEITINGDILHLYDELSFEDFNFILNKDKFYYLNTLLRQINGYLLVNFHMEYKYDLSDKKNELVNFNFNESIYSINYKLAEENKNKYLLFQILSCEYISNFNVIFFKEKTNFSYSSINDDNNGNIEKISEQNIFGFINLENINNKNETNFISVIQPRKLFIRYLYTNSKVDMSIINSLDDESKYQYNINIEKIRKVENKDIFSISFDCFLKNTITNYFILTLKEEEEDIVNECQFLSYLYKFKNKVFTIDFNNNYNNFFSNSIIYKKYISFKDEGINNRISREITFENYGNYKVYILAEELENYSLYKLLGVKTYSYINDGTDSTEDKKEGEVSIVLILLIIVLTLLIIILSAFIIYHYVRKENINQIIKFMNLPKNDPMNLDKNNLLISFISNRSENSNNSNNLLFPILNNSNSEEENKNNSIENQNNKIENNEDNNEKKELDIDEEKSEPPPPAMTPFLPENKISELMKGIKYNQSNNNNLHKEDKMYTNEGTNLTHPGKNFE